MIYIGGGEVECVVGMGGGWEGVGVDRGGGVVGVVVKDEEIEGLMKWGSGIGCVESWNVEWDLEGGGIMRDVVVWWIWCRWSWVGDEVLYLMGMWGCWDGLMSMRECYGELKFW